MFRRNRPQVVKHDQEETAVQLRIMRTHIAAQADQLSSLTMLVTQLVQVQRDHGAIDVDWRERFERALLHVPTSVVRQILHPALCEHAPDGGNHPVVPE